MKVTRLWVYPIKALRGIRLDEADLGPQGIRHDRTFMICRVTEKGVLEKVQLAAFPQCALFSQEIAGDVIRVRYHSPGDPLVAPRPEHDEVLEVPLEPQVDQLAKSDVNLYQSLVSAYRMGSPYDDWFSACFGFDIALMYIGDGRRPVLGTFSPRSAPAAQTPAPKGWLSSITSYVSGDAEQDEPDWLTFTDMAPFLITTEASLANVSRRLESGEMDMVKFRPNIVVDGEGEWEEDFWSELAVQDGTDSKPTFALTKLCNRCVSINIDYATGRIANGDHGIVLKKLMADRRVDAGYKFSPSFGRYAFFKDGVTQLRLTVGDSVEVTGRTEKRPVWDWPLRDPTAARFYNQRV